MRYLTGRVFEHLEIISPTDMDKRIAYTQCILRGAAIKKIPRGLGDMPTVVKYIAYYEWTLGDMKRLAAEGF